MNAFDDFRGTVERYLPLLPGLRLALSAGTVLKKMFWTTPGMQRARCAGGIHSFG